MRGGFRGRGGAPRHGAKPKPTQITVAQAKSQMQMLLVGCRDDRLAELTSDKLVSLYRVPADEAEYALQMERKRRAEFDV